MPALAGFVEEDAEQEDEADRPHDEERERVPDEQDDEHVEPAGPPFPMRLVQMLAASRYRAARSIAGSPHLRPRRVRIRSSRMLVGM